MSRMNFKDMKNKWNEFSNTNLALKLSFEFSLYLLKKKKNIE